MILEIDNLGLSAASSRAANDAEKGSKTSATGNDVTDLKMHMTLWHASDVA